jgi:geranylgeranyl reductase family protein
VLVIGAGPAGASAARGLALRGVRVILTDQRAFPRDKVCGDGLISDTIGALDTLGVRERVMREAQQARELRVYAPGGRYVGLRGAFACIPRERLDALLLDAAIESGATFLPQLTAAAPLEREGRVGGARFQSGEGVREITARVTLLATGANATALAAFGCDVPLKPMGTAGRAYFEAPPDVALEHPHLTIAYQREWCPGYGWIFPSPGNRFNIGVGLFTDGADAARGLRDFWQFFLSRFEPAARIVRASKPASEFRGAPMRTGLTRAQFGRHGLLVIGEAAAMTYPATGEGIGKAMESGLMAADLSAAALTDERRANTLHDDYARRFRSRFERRYRAYHVAQSWASSPLVLNLLAARANGGRFVRRELEALIAEEGDAEALFSATGLVSALVR